MFPDKDMLCRVNNNEESFIAKLFVTFLSVCLQDVYTMGCEIMQMRRDETSIFCDCWRLESVPGFYFRSRASSFIL